MDQKHAMLYPDIDPTHNVATHDHRISASAAMGLPTEAPPSYDMAIASTSVNEPNSRREWNPSAPSVATADPQPQSQASQQFQQQREQQSQHDSSARPVIVVQPLPQQQHSQSAAEQAAPTPMSAKLGPNPCAILCPACGANKTTRMVFTPNTRTHICAAVLCLAGWCCCACMVPYCMDSCQTGNHYCAQCNTFLGVYNPRRARK